VEILSGHLSLSALSSTREVDVDDGWKLFVSCSPRGKFERFFPASAANADWRGARHHSREEDFCLSSPQVWRWAIREGFKKGFHKLGSFLHEKVGPFGSMLEVVSRTDTSF